MIPVTEIKLALSLLPDLEPEAAESYLQSLCEMVYRHGVVDGYRECGEKMAAASSASKKNPSISR